MKKIAPAAPAVDAAPPAAKKDSTKPRKAPATPAPAAVEVAPPPVAEVAPAGCLACGSTLPGSCLECAAGPDGDEAEPTPLAQAGIAGPFVVALAEEPAPMAPVAKGTSSKLKKTKKPQPFVGIREVVEPAATDPHRHLRAINAQRNVAAAVERLIRALPHASSAGAQAEADAALSALQALRAKLAGKGKKAVAA